MARALILGINGQDGSYLAEHLLAAGMEVFGLGRAASLTPYLSNTPVCYVQCDIAETRVLRSHLDAVQPDEIYHVAAVHGASGFAYEPVFPDAMAVNTTSLYPILEYMRGNSNSRLLYASSSKVFGPLHGEITENTPQVATCLYSLTKIAAGSLIAHYRSQFGLKAGIVYLFQHESPRRGPLFFIPTLVRELAACRENVYKQLALRTLNFYCDWGYAAEYMQLAVRALRDAPGEDFVLATGHTVYARDLAQELCDALGLVFSRHFQENASPQEGAPYRVSVAKMQSMLGGQPQISIGELCRSMLS